jgi:hypothetical protein
MKCEYRALVETDYKRGKQKYSGKKLSQFKIYHRKSKMELGLIKSHLRDYIPPNKHPRHCTAIISFIHIQIAAILDVMP